VSGRFVNGRILGWFLREAGGTRYLGQTEIGGALWLVPRGMARNFYGPGEAILTARAASKALGCSFEVEEWSGAWSSPRIVVEGAVIPVTDSTVEWRVASTHE
jgi:hypothetical protein